MAMTFAPPVFLGERASRLRRFAPLDRSARPAPAAEPAESAQSAGAVETTADAPAVTLSAPQPLTALASAIESAESSLVELDETALSRDARCRLALVTLGRRADKRGKTLVFRHATPEMRALAVAAGLAVEPLARTASRAEQAETAGNLGTGSAGVLARIGLAGRDAVGQEALTSPAEGLGGRDARAPSAARMASAVAVRLGELPSVAHAAPAVARALAAAPRLVPRTPGMAIPAGAAAGCLLLAGAFFLYPSAQVEMVAASETWNVEIPIVVDPSLKKADVSKGALPGRAVTKELSETASAPATGKKTVPDAKASGEVVLLNRSDKSVQVPKGTVVLAGTVKFATQADVTVAPSRSAGSSQSFGMASVKVMAVTGGPSGNVARDQINKVEGPLGASLTVQNNAPTRGGTERAITYVTEDDRKKLQELLTKSLTEKLNQQVKKELAVSDKETLVPWTGQNPAVVEATFSKNAEEEAPSVSLTLKLRYGATVFANDAYNAFVQELTTANARNLKPGYRLAPGSVQAEAPVVTGTDNGALRLTGRARATVSTQVDESAVRRALAGKPVAQAHAYLGSVPGAAEYDLKVSGLLPGRLPPLGWRIGVRAKTPA